jgi:hypothetical protein
MHAGRARFVALAWATILFASCDTNPVEPDAGDPSLAANLADPLNLRVTETTHSQIGLAWDDMSSRETGFELHRSTAGGLFVITTGFNVTSVSDGGLAAETQYCYQIRSFRTTGTKTHYSGFSDPACATTQPLPLLPAPSLLNAIPVGSTAVQVSWTSNPSNVTHFRVERSTDAGVTWVGAGSTPYTVFTDLGRTRNEQVCYRAIAVNSYGSYGDSPPSNMDCTAPPAAPILTASPGLPITLTWTVSPVADGYEVLRRFEYCDYYSYYYPYCYEYYASISGTLGPTITSFTDANVNAGEYHSYYVIALKDGGQSDPSIIASASTDAPPP